MESIKRLQNLYLAYGVYFESKSKLIKLINYTILLNFVVYVTRVSMSVYRSFKWMLIDSMFRLVVYGHFYYEQLINRQSKRIFLDKLGKLASYDLNNRQSLKRARNYKVFLIGYTFLAAVSEIISNYDYDYIVKLRPFSLENVSYTWKVTYFVWDGIFGYLAPQCVVLMVFEYLLVLRTLTSIKLTLIQNQTLPNAVTHLRWRQVCSLTDDFDDIYSLTPFFKVTQDFIGALIYIVYLCVNQKVMRIDTQVGLIYFATQLIIDLYVICVIDKSNASLKKAVNELKEKSAIYVSGHFEKWTDEVSQSYRFNLTGYGLFNLEKSLVIGFGASLISFTVLFIQISSM